MERVYCAVGVESLNVLEFSVGLYIKGGKSNPRRSFSPSISISPVSIIPPLIHTHLHLRVSLISRTN